MRGCSMCDDNGMAMVLPETATTWETVARCPHYAAALLEIKRQAEADQVAHDFAHPRPHTESGRTFDEPIRHELMSR